VGMLSSHLGRNGEAMLDGFNLITRFTVPFGDVDMLQHVNNIAYIRWMEIVRTEYFARVLGADINSAEGMIQANISFQYEKQIAYRESVAVGVRVSRIGTKSFDFTYEIWSETHGHRCAHGTTAIVAYDFVKRESIAIPDVWRRTIDAFEQGPQIEFR
jgi:acyl-CoA thioester hydrolase